MTCVSVTGKLSSVIIVVLLIIYYLRSVAIKCPALNVSSNVIKSGCLDDVEEIFGTVCSFHCPFGFTASGSSLSKCQASGTWDVNDFTCIGKSSS